MFKISVICPGFGVIPRGIETVVKEVFFGLAENDKNYKIDIYCGAEKKIENTPENITLKKFKISEFNSKISKFYSKIAKKYRFPASEPFDYNFLIFSLKIIPELFNNEYDIIFNNGGIFSAYVCGLYRKFYKKPYIHSGHAGINSLERYLGKLYPDVYIASTEPAKLWIESEVKGIKCEVIPNGINPKIFFPAKSDENKLGLKIKMKRPVYLFTGALTRQKQPDKVLRAFIQNNAGSLIIIGNGELKEEILNISKEHNLGPEGFLYIENVDYEKLPEYFNFCDYFVMPSINETFGIVYLMALACNKPVISDDKPQQRWMIKNAGIYCDAENYDSIKSAMNQICKENFFEIPVGISAGFHWKNIIKSYEELIVRTVIQNQREY
ncbi:glycosyltransferase family 4 protein [Candidatus Dependentiae bacterium]|nr:glycosyltransferase family 4 protein [Candidatus Dependentiae bacterium]